MDVKLSELLKAFDARLSALEHTVNDVVVKSLVEANDQYEYDQGLEAFRTKYPQVADLDPRLKALYGDDYDTGKNLYDALPKEYAEGDNEEAFVARTLEEVNAKLDALMQVAGGEAEPEATAEATAEAEAEPEGEVTEEIEVPSEEQLRAELKAAQGR